MSQNTKECGQFTGSSADGTEWHCKKPSGHGGSCDPLFGVSFTIEELRGATPMKYNTGVVAPDGYEESMTAYQCDHPGCKREAEYGRFCEEHTE